MIRVIDNYGIDVSDHCYAVGKIITTKKTGKDGTVVEYETIQQPAYFPTFERCLKWLAGRLRADSLRGIDCDLKTALHVMSEAEERLNKVLSCLGYRIVKQSEELHNEEKE